MKRRLSPPAVEIPKKRIALNGLPLPNAIREGELFTDLLQKRWKIGRSIGQGGFGEIYLASDNLDRPVTSDAKYIIKVEPHNNGPLFVEMNFYIRAAKRDMINSWITKRGLSTLGIPNYVSSGSHRYKGERYRFLVLPRYGLDIHKVFLQHGRRFHIKTAFTLASYIIDCLQYIHEHEYVHVDIKGSNLILGLNSHAPVYLMDFGLATRYIDRMGNHKEYVHDERRAHAGTIEYTSRDAHIGVHSRRGDLEILGYNLVQWLTGKLPWEGNLEAEEIHKRKIAAMKNIGQFLKTCFTNSQPPSKLQHYLQYIAHLGFETKPNYEYCKRLFREGIREAGFENDGKLTFTNHQKRCKINKAIKIVERENKGIKVKKVIAGPTRQPCVPRNVNRITRNAANAFPTLRSKSEFDWALILAGDPEKMLRKERPTCVPVDQIVSEMPTKLVDRAQNSHVLEIPEELDNPTPEMIKVWNRMKQRVKEQESNNSSKRSKNGSRSSSPVQIEGEALTPAMEDVIQRRESIPRTVRSSRRISEKSRTSELIFFKKNVPATTNCKQSIRRCLLKG